MRANELLKHNIDTLLRRRGQTRKELAEHARQSLDKKKIEPWISQIFTNDDREFQMKYLDRIAGFFGLEVYQLFQPGISPLTERRKGIDRRSGMDRRIGRTRAMRQPMTRETLSPRLQEFLTDADQLRGEHFDEAHRWIRAQIVRQALRPDATPIADQNPKGARRRAESKRKRKGAAES